MVVSAASLLVQEDALAAVHSTSESKAAWWVSVVLHPLYYEFPFFSVVFEPLPHEVIRVGHLQDPFYCLLHPDEVVVVGVDDLLDEIFKPLRS